MLTPCRLGRRSLQQAAMLASARPPCRSSTRTVSRHQSGHKHLGCMRCNFITTGHRAIGFTPPKQSRLPKLYSHHNHAIGRLCGDVFASDSAAMHTGAGGHANDFMQCVPLSTMGSHANDFMQHLQHRPYSNNLALAPRRQQPIRQGRAHQNQYSTPQHLPRDRFVQQHNTDQIRH